MRYLSLMFGALLLIISGACEDATVKDDEPKPLPEAASMDDGVEVWDLRQRPSPAQVGVTGDDQTAVYETRPSRQVRLRLAGGARLDLPIRYIAFSTILSRDDGLHSVDLKTDTMDRDELVRVLTHALEQLGLSTKLVDDFERRAARATGSDTVTSKRVTAHFEALDLSVLARYTPDTGRGRVALGGGWQ